MVSQQGQQAAQLFENGERSGVNTAPSSNPQVDTSSIVINQLITLAAEQTTFNAETVSHSARRTDFQTRYAAHTAIIAYSDNTFDLESKSKDLKAEAASLDAEKKALELEMARLHQKKRNLREKAENIRGMVALQDIKAEAEEAMESLKSLLED